MLHGEAASAENEMPPRAFFPTEKGGGPETTPFLSHNALASEI